MSAEKGESIKKKSAKFEPFQKPKIKIPIDFAIFFFIKII
jgi:hypothetical protein